MVTQTLDIEPPTYLEHFFTLETLSQVEPCLSICGKSKQTVYQCTAVQNIYITLWFLQ